MFAWMFMLSVLSSSISASTVQQQGEIAAPETKKKASAYVYHCHDGDTCRVLIEDSIWTNVRLAGIDAPEVKSRKALAQPMGDKARDFLNEQVQGKQVALRQVDLDPYNRPVVEIFLNEQHINVALLEQGLAERYRGKVKRLDVAIYEKGEKVAKDNKKGIWAQTSYVSPRDFRKLHK